MSECRWRFHCGQDVVKYSNEEMLPLRIIALNRQPNSRDKPPEAAQPVSVKWGVGTKDCYDTWSGNRGREVFNRYCRFVKGLTFGFQCYIARTEPPSHTDLIHDKLHKCWRSI